MTQDASYAQDASQFLSDFGNSYAFCSDWALCWGNMWPVVNLIFGNAKDNLINVKEPTWGALNNQMMQQVATTLDSFMTKNKVHGTYISFDNWGSARYNTAMQLVGMVYDKYNNTTSYTTWAKSQMDYLLGDNVHNLCYVTGFADNSVTQPHHRARSEERRVGKEC